MNPLVESFFDVATWTFTHVVHAGPGSACAIIDSVLDYDPKSGRTATVAADKVVAFVREQGLRVEWILETHAHADHLSAAPYLQAALGGKTAIGEHIRLVQGVFKNVFNLEADFKLDGSQFDHLFVDGETFQIGALTARVMHTPGHTPACVSYAVGDAVFIGDTLFPPDVGTARCDFPGGDARHLYQSARRLLGLPGGTRLFMCHDYPPTERPVTAVSSVADERAGNIHVKEGVSEEEFVAMRVARDATLSMPVLILPAVQVNIRAGQFPPPEANGVRYLKIPLNTL